MTPNRLDRKPHPRLPTTTLVLVVTAVLSTGWLGAEEAIRDDWPQFRGQERDGVARDTLLAESWPEAGPPELWRRPLGEGFSGISAVGDRLYTLDARGEVEFALALDAETGEELWRCPIDRTFQNEFGNGPRSTPTVVGGVVYVLGSHGRLYALDAETGGQLWEVDLAAEFGGEVPRWGFAPSPLVEGDRVLVEAGGLPGQAIVALDRETGELRWQTEEGAASYSSPILADLHGQRQAIFLRRNGPEVLAVEPATGEVLWRHSALPATVAIPLFVPPDRLLLTAGDDAGAKLLEIGPEGEVEEVWAERTLRSYVNGVVLVGDHLYGFDNATLRAVAVADGELAWARRGFGKGSLIVAENDLIVLGDRGVLARVEATPEAYREKGRFQALEGKTWTAPTLAHGRLYLRDHDEIVAFDLRPAATE